MRIGIVTFWQSADNYGQQLQCWALQRYLTRLGHEPYLIRYLYKEPVWRRCLKIIVKAALIYPLLDWWKHRDVRRMETVNRVKNKVRRFEEFRNSHINQTERIYSTLKELRQDPPAADVYIAGSDQIWHPVLLKRKDDRAFWLDFGEERVRRVAYAASYGVDECPSKFQKELSKRLSRFDALSVREESGGSICRTIGKEAAHVLDPTLLLLKDDYPSLLEDIPVRLSPYIFIYSINISSKEDIQWSELRGFAEREELSLVVTPASGYLPGRELFEGVEYRYATIPEWLSLIRYSGLVVTTSFHGVVFCILFHKRFVYFPLKNRYSTGNSRVIGLLNELGLNNFVWDESKNYKCFYETFVDWLEVDNRLSFLRDKSMLFLEKELLK